MSFLKYQHDQDVLQGNGRGPVSFARAHIDGAPYRGPALPLREEEYYDYTEEVLDFDCGIFDIRDKEEYIRLRTIMDRASNDWYRIVDYQTKWGERSDGSTTMFVYLAWAIPHRELAKQRAVAEIVPTPVPMQ